MSFLKRLASLFTGKSSSGGRNLTVYVLSTRCNEPLSAQVDTLNALSGSDDGDAALYTRKVIQGTGKNRCFAQVEVELWFNSQRGLLRHAVTGGRWLTAEEYETELERFNAPPEEEEDDEIAGADTGGSGGFG
ncbi:MAG: hypothetical protein KJZ86_05585 [Caldilineaceae bacterium]|nr:hypothetical protein [Caldilineaceae bacterium]HRJ43314.1 hypothetical protein [Caldilineaceae bacterium]